MRSGVRQVHACNSFTTPVLSPWRSASMPRPCSIVSQALHSGVLLRQHEMLAELQARAAAGEDRGAVVEVVDRADVAAVGERGVIEQARAVGFLHRLQLVEQAGEQFALRDVAPLRSLQPLAGGVVAHVVRGDFDVEAARAAMPTGCR